ncbi:MAG TPA: hypothetical protein VG929_10985 [Actinomycetota bacterium]|nr:hypothetical protein [Actinomycetota bacterium]
MKKISIPLVLCLFAGVACWPFDGDDVLAAMTLRKVNKGRVEIQRGAERIRVEEEDVGVEAGDVVRTFAGALAQVALEGDRVAWVGGIKQLVPGAPSGQMRIVDTRSVENESGTVMAEADDPMEVAFGDAVATADDATFRVDRRSGSSRAASYTGTIRLSAPGEANITLDRLLEVPATAGDLRSPQPYRLNPEDPFDVRRLETVIDLEARLGQLSAGFANQLGRQKPDLAYFKALARGKDVSVMRRYLRKPAIDLVLGFTVADNARGIPFAKAVPRAFRYRDDGGTWGIVAALLDSQPRALVADLQDIIVGSQVVAGGTGNDATFTVAAGQAAALGTAPQPPTGPGGTAAQPPPDGGGGGDGGGTDGGDGGGDPEDPEDPPECTSGPECDVQEVRDRILPSPSPSDLVSGALGG